MCAHYTLFLDEGMLALLGRPGAAALADIYPGSTAPVLKPVDGALQPCAMVWGFPVELENGKHKAVFNTRVETARTKGLWKNAYRYRRCVIPATAFEEWQHNPGGKTLFSFTAQGEPLYIAGVFERRADGNEYFSMLTTAPSEAIADVHDRMPLVLREAELPVWLHGSYDTLADRGGLPLRRTAVLCRENEAQQLSMF